MCEVCQLEYDADHATVTGPWCSCGRFRVGEKEPWETPGCYHCFAEAARLDACVTCQATRN